MIIPRENLPLQNDANIWYVRYCNIHNQAHWHDEPEIILVRSGTVDVIINGVLYSGKQGDVFLCESEDIHTMISNGVSELDFLIFTKSIFKNWDRFRIRCPHISPSSVLQKHFDDIIYQLQNPDQFSKMYLYNLIENLMIDLYRIGGSTDKNPCTDNSVLANYRSLIDYIDKCYATINFEEAARFMAFSPAYFSRMFSVLCGTTFTRYLNTVRIEKSLSLIAKGVDDISQIALDCGFGSVRHYNRIFKELTGYTPSSIPSSFCFQANFKKSTDLIFNPNLKGYKCWEHMI